ncbi:hypothetical protein RND71_033080 [Anisodus tanguticus]|uniref:Uncharacterized protein n=1 Tax=Anisodus tanguticus TaxID=243964 RepID=A0AAE1R7U4_9SOLA|nr:hypothetical protein RND71_033080 [Anisodus tanguticus]
MIYSTSSVFSVRSLHVKFWFRLTSSAIQVDQMVIHSASDRLPMTTLCVSVCVSSTKTTFSKKKSLKFFCSLRCTLSTLIRGKKIMFMMVDLQFRVLASSNKFEE